MTQKIIKSKSATKGRKAGSIGLAAKVELVKKMSKNQPSAFNVGDSVAVHVRIKEGEKERIQLFEGVVIKRSHRAKSFTVRKISHGVGVERIFLESSPKVAQVEVRQPGKVRRAKIYYIRGLEGKSARIERDIRSS